MINNSYRFISNIADTAVKQGCFSKSGCNVARMGWDEFRLDFAAVGVLRKVAVIIPARRVVDIR